MINNIREVLNMAEPEPKSISGEPTPEAPQEPADVARKIKDDPKELYREVSGAYEAKQEREAGRPRQKRSD
jgi:hypothetical protein